MDRLILAFALCFWAGVGVAATHPAAQTSRHSTPASSPNSTPMPYIPHGHIGHHIYTTEIGANLANNREDYYVYTPPGYDQESPTKYPVLYLLHGFEQNSCAWIDQGLMKKFMDALIALGRVRPMIVVMPLSYGDYNFLKGGKLAWLSPKRIDANVTLFSRMLLYEIIPRVESEYQVSTKQEDRAIAGLSMGGREAITIGLDNPKKFRWVGGFSSAFPDFQRFVVPAYKHDDRNPQTYWIACGIADQALIFKGNMRVIADLNGQGRTVTSVVTHGVHDWGVWSEDFVKFSSLIFH